MTMMVQTDFEHVACFDVDPQKCFTPICPDELPVPEGTQIVNELNAQAAFASLRIGSKDAHCRQAIWVADEQHPQFETISGDNVDIRWNLHAVPGTVGFEYIDGLPTPAEYNYFIWKGIEKDIHPYGACYHDLHNQLSTGVIEFLTMHHIRVVIIGGLATDYCVKTTVLQLLTAGFVVIVNLAACRGVNQQTTQTAITEMKTKGAFIVECSVDIPKLIASMQVKRA